MSRMKRGAAALALRFYAGADLESSIRSFLLERTPESGASVAAAVVRRMIRVRVWLVAISLIGGLAGSSLLIWQNIEIRHQTAIAVGKEAHDQIRMKLSKLNDDRLVFEAAVSKMTEYAGQGEWNTGFKLMEDDDLAGNQYAHTLLQSVASIPADRMDKELLSMKLYVLAGKCFDGFCRRFYP